MRFTEGAPNSIAVRAIRKTDDGKLIATVKLDNQEEDFFVSDILSDEDCSIIDSQLKSAFGVFLPALVQKLLNQ